MEDNNRNDNQGEAEPEEFLGNENNDNPGDEGNEDENEGDGGNNNDMIDIDLEEDEEDGDNDSTYDGGVAANPEGNSDNPSSKPKKHSSECDLVSGMIWMTVRRRNQYIIYAQGFIQKIENPIVII